MTQKQTIEETLTSEPSTEQQLIRRQTILPSVRPPSFVSRSSSFGARRRSTFFEMTAKYYEPFTQNLSTATRHRNFNVNLSPKLTVQPDELKRFSIIQVEKRSKSFSNFFLRFRHVTLVDYSIQTSILHVAKQQLLSKLYEYFSFVIYFFFLIFFIYFIENTKNENPVGFSMEFRPEKRVVHRNKVVGGR